MAGMIVVARTANKAVVIRREDYEKGIMAVGILFDKRDKSFGLPNFVGSFFKFMDSLEEVKVPENFGETIPSDVMAELDARRKR